MQVYRVTRWHGRFSPVVHDELAWVKRSELAGYRLHELDVQVAAALNRPCPSSRRTARFRLKRRPAAAVRGGHPWVFRDALGPADFPEGQWLELFEEGPLGYGIYQAEGGLAVRMLGPDAPRGSFLTGVLRRAARKKAPLLRETDAFRLLNGESDGLPGVVIDVYGSVAVLQTYTRGVDALGRAALGEARRQQHLTAALWKFPTRRADDRAQTVRVMWGSPPEVVTFREGPLVLAADLGSGQKSGTFLDLRGLRRWLAAQNLEGARVLNLFSYTGAAGLACCLAGAREVVNVDQAQASLDFGARHHAHPAQRWLNRDIFADLKTIGPGFDLIIVDPPSMASNQEQVPKALAIYKRLYKALPALLTAEGQVVACCCTSRISPAQFERALGMRVLQRLPMELDHRPRFPEADYLKVMIAQPGK
jgi:23S rRNA (cytosine1962-C5)-methyltransferase